MLAWHKSQLKELPMAKAGTIWESKVQKFFILKAKTMIKGKYTYILTMKRIGLKPII